MKKQWFYLLTLATATVFFSCQNQPAGEANLSLNDTDKEFMQKVKEANLAEIKAGQIAQEKGGPVAAYFGSLMVAEHTKATESLDSLAQAIGITLVTEISAEHQNAENELVAKSAAEFDKAYLDMQVKEHQDVMGIFRNEKLTGSHEDVKGFAKRFMPHIKMHLELADSLRGEINSVGSIVQPVLK